LRKGALDARWRDSAPRYLVAVTRETVTGPERRTTVEHAYYITNASSRKAPAEHLPGLATAVRGHWRGESNNWVRDVTLGEDDVRTRFGHRGQVLALLRSLVLILLRKATGENLRATIEQFCYVPATLVAVLKKVKFL
jgi:hypothetical protein